MFRPGELTRQYLAGRRRHYVLPLRLYLTVSLLALVLVRLVATAELSIEDPARAAPPRPAQAQIALGPGRAGLKDGVFFCQDLPAWLCQRLKKRIDVDAKGMTDQLERFNDRFLGNLGGAMFVLLPIFALWLKLAYFNRHMRYTEHLVFALHLHAFWFLVVALFTTGIDTLIAIGMLVLPVYSLLAARRVYGGRWSRHAIARHGHGAGLRPYAVTWTCARRPLGLSGLGPVHTAVCRVNRPRSGLDQAGGQRLHRFLQLFGRQCAALRGV